MSIENLKRFDHQNIPTSITLPRIDSKGSLSGDETVPYLFSNKLKYFAPAQDKLFAEY